MADYNSGYTGAELDAGVALAYTALQSETSHADVVVDGDFATNGVMNRTGAGLRLQDQRDK